MSLPLGRATVRRAPALAPALATALGLVTLCVPAADQGERATHPQATQWVIKSYPAGRSTYLQRRAEGSIRRACGADLIHPSLVVSCQVDNLVVGVSLGEFVSADPPGRISVLLRLDDDSGAPTQLLLAEPVHTALVFPDPDLALSQVLSHKKLSIRYVTDCSKAQELTFLLNGLQEIVGELAKSGCRYPAVGRDGPE